MKTARKRLSMTIAAAMILPVPCLVAAPAMAQQQAQGIEEVVVTARKREESLQDTPVAISAMTGTSLQDAGFTNVKNLAESVPGLSLEESGTGGAPSAYIRGVGQANTDQTLEGGVAIYIDGLYQGRPDGTLMDFLDIANVQVLRGPQGTLFGKNSTSGAMLIDTNKPNENFEGNLLLRAGNYNRRDAQLTVNVPLIENTLYSRYSLSSVRRDGYMEQKAPGTDITIADWNDQDRLSAQAQFRWMASDAVTVDFNYNWGKQREKGRGSHCIYVFDRPDIQVLTGGALPPALPFAIQFVGGFTPESTFANYCKAQSGFDPVTGLPINYLKDDEFYASTPGRYENDVQSFAVTVNWDIGDLGLVQDAALKSITGWRAVDTIQNQEIDGTAMPLIDRTWLTPRQSDQYSQEFQLNFTAMDGKLQGVSGLFLYSEQTVDGIQDSFIGPFPIDSAILPAYMDNVAGPLAGTSGPFIVANYDAVWYSDRSQKLDTSTKTAAVFTQLTYEVNDIVSLTAGLRWNWEKKGLDAAFYELAANAGSGIVEANTPFPDANANGLAAKDILGPACGAPCDVGALLPGLGAGFYVGDIIPSGTGFFVPKSMSGGGYDAAAAYLQRNVHRQWIGDASHELVNRSWTPMFNVSFNAPDSVLDTLNLNSAMSYFTYSRGFKSGGIVPASILSLQEFNPEKVDNYEIGLKLDAADRKVRYNLALFYMDYEDIQVTVATANPTNPIDVNVGLSNAGVASISGVESELTWLPISGMLVQFNVAYTEARFSEYEYSYVAGIGATGSFDRANPCDGRYPGTPLTCAVEPLPGSMPWKVYLAAQYSFMGDFGAITPRVDANYISGTLGGFDFISYQARDWTIDEGTIYNASLSWDLPDNKTSIRAWVRNIENRQYRIGVSPIPEITGGGSYSLSEPRTYGIDFQYAF